MSLACETCPVRDSAACSVLNDEERAALAKAGRSRKLAVGEMLFAAGDEHAACATLTEGALKIVSGDRDGNEQILSLVHPAGFVGEMFSPFAHHDVVALTDSTLCTFSKADMQSALDAYPALAKALLRRSQEDLHGARSRLHLTAKASAETRLAALLLDFADAASDSPCHPAHQFDLPLSRADIGNMLGLTIETVSRKLGALEKSGVIKRNGKRGIELVDPAHLYDLAGRD